jgi:methyl-accepting chemotaxis protein
MDKVTQQNAAGAEESAAAAEQLSAQAASVKATVAELVQLVGGARQAAAVGAASSFDQSEAPTL